MVSGTRGGSRDLAINKQWVFFKKFVTRTRDCIDIFKKAAQEDITPEQSSLAGRLSRLKISESILQMATD